MNKHSIAGMEFAYCSVVLYPREKSSTQGRLTRAETKALKGGGGGEYSYLRVLPDEFFLKPTLITTDFKRISALRLTTLSFT